MKKDKEETTKVQEDIAKQQAKMDKQMKNNNDMMHAMKVTMQAQAIASGTASNIECMNHFSNLAVDSEDDEDNVDDENPGDDFDGAVDEPDDITSNSNVESYSKTLCSLSSPPQPHTILAKCRKLSINPSSAYTVVDSGASVPMDNDSCHFEYITPGY